jgi:hypothetical protein
MKKIFLAILLFLSFYSHAGKIYHCETASGKKSFQSTPCEVSTLKIENAKPAVNKKKSKSALFYGISVHSTAKKKEISDHPSVDIATLRYISIIPKYKMVKFYKESIKEKYKLREVGGTTMISYKLHGRNKMISIDDYFSKSDVTIQSEK